jgi:hypothetical protein
MRCKKWTAKEKFQIVMLGLKGRSDHITESHAPIVILN